MKHTTTCLLSWAFYGVGHVAYLLSYGFGILHQKIMGLHFSIKEWGDV